MKSAIKVRPWPHHTRLGARTQRLLILVVSMGFSSFERRYVYTHRERVGLRYRGGGGFAVADVTTVTFSFVAAYTRERRDDGSRRVVGMGIYGSRWSAGLVIPPAAQCSCQNKWLGG